MKKLFLGITTLSLSLFCSAPLWAAPVTPPKPAKNVETRITSDQLTYLAEKQLVIFDKNVHVVRPDIEIWADRITVYLKPPKGDAQKKEGEKGGMPAGMAAGDVDRIVAERNVRMKSENRNGTCAKATYTMDDGVLLMEGDPRLTPLPGKPSSTLRKKTAAKSWAGPRSVSKLSFPALKTPVRSGGTADGPIVRR